MLTKCPKCFYQRTAADHAPDWQCPKCGVAYNKVTPEGIAAAARLREAKSIKQKAPEPVRGGGPWKMVACGLFLIALAGFAYWKTHRAAAVGGGTFANEAAEGKKAFDAQDIGTAYEILMPLAEKGDAQAQYYVGLTYHFIWQAHGVRHGADPKEELRWLKKSGEQNYVPAQIEIGKMIDRGFGDTTDRAPATAWYRRAAERGDPDGQYRLGTAYANGVGVDKDDAQAAAWFRRSAVQGTAGAMFSLAKLYAEGKGVEQDLGAAYALLILAADINKRHPEVEGAFWAQSSVEEFKSKGRPVDLERGEQIAKTWTPGQAFPF